VSNRKLLAGYAITGLVISVPFTIIHLLANPDDAPITPLQHIMAAGANFFGPWAAAIVRLVDFPNAGLRSFSWLEAFGMTLLGGVLVVLAMRIAKQCVQIVLATGWVLFSIAWFGIGFRQIADGLL
jgi:hypothetical protein